MSNSYPCTARRCADISGVAPQSDVTLYSLQDRLFFNGVPLSFILTCQPGFYCRPGLFPRVITFPPGTFSIPYPPTGGFPIVLQLQGCSSLVSVTLPANSTEAAIQAAANQIILGVAQQQAVCAADSLSSPVPTVITMSDAPEFFCEDVAAEFTITGSTTGITFILFEGSLPTGMTMTENEAGTAFTASGTPTTAGTYVFTIYAMAPGLFGQKTFTVVVGGISTASPLPEATLEEVYSETLTATLTGTLSWSVADGALPAGLTLNVSTGEISGTPLQEETANFTIAVTNGTDTCEKEFVLEVGPAAGDCPDWTLIPWDNAFVATVGGGTASFTPINSPSDSFVSEAAIPSFTDAATSNNEGTFQYNGPGCNCNLHVEAVVTGSNLWANLVIFQNGGFVLNDIVATSGTYDFPFVIADTGGVPQDIRVVIGNDLGSPNGWPASRSLTGQITNV